MKNIQLLNFGNNNLQSKYYRRSLFISKSETRVLPFRGLRVLGLREGAGPFAQVLERVCIADEIFLEYCHILFSCNSPEIKPCLSHPYIQTLIAVIHDLSRDISQELQLIYMSPGSSQVDMNGINIVYTL